MATITGRQLKQWREQRNITRYFVSHCSGIPYAQIAHLEWADAPVDDEIVQGYANANRHLQNNSLSNSTVGGIKWSSPKSTERLEKWA